MRDESSLRQTDRSATGWVQYHPTICSCTSIKQDIEITCARVQPNASMSSNRRDGLRRRPTERQPHLPKLCSDASLEAAKCRMWSGFVLFYGTILEYCQGLLYFLYSLF